MKRIAYFALMILVSACQKEKKSFDSNPLLYKEYISAFSSGIVSATEPIQVVLNQAVSADKSASIADLKLFDISPKIKGKVVATSATQLQFVPEERLDEDTEYRITFHLGKIFSVPDELKKFMFSVKTKKQSFSIQIDDLQSYNEKLYFANATLFANDVITPEVAQKNLSASIDNQRISLKINEKSAGNKFTFVADSIIRNDAEATLKIHWDGNLLSEKNELNIPAKNDFGVVQILTPDEKNQSFWVNFSEPLDKNQDFSGLVAFENSGVYQQLKYSVSGNVLKVFSEQPLEGTYSLSVRQGIRSVYGKRTDSDKEYSVTFLQRKPEVKLLRSGTILPSSENLKINFQAINLRAVNVTVTRIYENNVLQFLQENSLQTSYEIRRVGKPIARKVLILSDNAANSLKQWNTYSLDLSSLINPEAGAIYRVTFGMTKNYSLYNCGEELPPLDTSFETISDDDQAYEYYDYYWGYSDSPCEEAYYLKEVSTNVLASDMGVIVKRGQNNDYTVVVNDIVSTEPVNAASVELFDYQQQSLKEMKTDKDGMAYFELKQKAYFAVVKKDKNTTYVKIDDATSLSVSKYDVDGSYWQKGINGYIYAERGVWRPGDSIFVGFVLNNFNSKSPDKLPIKLTLKDPYGKIITERMHQANDANHYTFTLTTPSDALTGNWLIDITAGAARFSKNIKIETIKPNRLKIDNSLNNSRISSKGSKASIEVAWLHGTALANSEVNIKANFYATETVFKGYESYNFVNKIHKFQGQETHIFDGRTDTQGKANFFFNANELQSPGMLRVNFLTRASEGGGDFSTDVSTAIVSPYSSYVGISQPDPNDYGYYETNKSHTFNIVSLTEEGKSIANKKINVSVYKTNWGWWWDATNNNMSSYNSSSSQNLYSSSVVTTDSQGKAQFSMEIPNGDWGSYYVLLSDSESGHHSGSFAYFDYSGDWGSRYSGENSDQAIMLNVVTDKKEYSVGEKISVSFPSDDDGRALISVENGTNVLETHWVKTEKGRTTFELTANRSMTPNVYLNISMLQPHASTANDSPIRLYGICPITITDKNSQLNPEIKMTDVLRPNQKASIKVSEKSGRPMTYTLAIVEDGLLNLTRFKTPNAWNTFFAKTALGVKTWDVYNDVIGAYGGAINQVFSIGGDDELAGSEAQKANRFKPLVIFKGPFELKKGKTNTHEIEIPNYVGSARVMVVASDVANNAFGSSEKNASVRSPLMILGSLPRKAVPGEKIMLPVTVFAMENHVKNVSLSIKTNENFTIVGERNQSLHFAETGEKMAYFELDTKSNGIGKVTVTATSGNEKASYEVEMDIYNPNPITYSVQHFNIESGATTTLEGQLLGEPSTSKTVLEVSAFPGINLHRRLDYLLSYPHGCLEQVTSGAFPQLYLNDLLNLNDEGNQQVSRNVKTAIAKLHKNQLPNGGFAYWNGQKYASDWATSYAGHFYIEAEKKGYVLPAGSKQQWLSYQANEARNWRYQPQYRNDIAQAYRLYTLALAGNPEMAAMNRLREIKEISDDARLRLAAAYAVAGQKRTAEGLFRTISFDKPYYVYYGSYVRDKAMALETALLIGNTNESHQWALDISERLSSDSWMSTQTTAYALYAMSQYINQYGKGKQMAFAYTINGKTEQVKTEEPMFSQEVKLSGNNSLQVKNESKQTLFGKLISSGKLSVGEELPMQNGLSINVEYRDALGKLLDETRVAQGTEIVATIRVANLTNEYIDNVALTQIIPSGWEIINVRYTDYGEDMSQFDSVDYRDDRANYYFSLNSNTQKVIKLRANASYAGRYYLPGTYAEAMYNDRYNTRTAGKWVEVTK